MSLSLKRCLIGLFAVMLALSVAQGVLALLKLDAIDAKNKATPPQ